MHSESLRPCRLSFLPSVVSAQSRRIAPSLADGSHTDRRRAGSLPRNAPPYQIPRMPLTLSQTAPTLLIKKSAFERVGLTRQQFDEALALTADDFRVEGGLIAIGPLVGEDTLTDLIAQLEELGLAYYDDFFELSGNWPDWLKLFVMDAGV
jgi:hypothetical protein